MSAEAKAAHLKVAELSDEVLQKRGEEFREIMDKYNNPVGFRDLETKTNVGGLNEINMNGSGASNSNTNPEFSEEVRENPHKIVDKDKIETAEKGESDGFLGLYEPKDNTITLAGTDMSRVTNETLKNDDYMSGSQLAQESVVLHEHAHKAHDEKVGLYNTTDTDIERLRKNRATETLAAATEYMAAASKYLDFKEKGLETFQDTRIDENGEKTVVDVPAERVLDYCPGLKEIVTKDGFDLNNSEDKRAVMEACAKWWKEERQDAYNAQALNALDVQPTLEQQFEALKNPPAKSLSYDEQIEAMSEIYTGGNRPLIDVSDCRDLFDTMSEEEAQKLIADGGREKSAAMQPLSRNSLKGIDTYFTELGLETSEEKALFLMNTYDDIVNRKNEDEVSVKIKDILLENGGTITYSDGLIETRQPNTNLRTIQQGQDGEAFVINADVDFSRPKEQQTELANVQVQSQQKNNGLSVAQMMALRGGRG